MTPGRAPLSMPVELYREIVDHCQKRQALDEEACGVLASPVNRPDEVTEAHHLANVADRPDYRWRFDPDEQRALWFDFDRRNMRPRAIYHSHLDTPAIMSETDIEWAVDPSIVHLIVSLSDWEARLWRVDAIAPYETELKVLWGNGIAADFTRLKLP